jgi:uncharacterized protein (TIGR02145 family)
MNQFKNIIIAVSVLLCLSFQGAQSQTMYVNLKNNSQNSFETENIRKLNFLENNIIIDNLVANSDTLALSELKSLTFTDFPAIREPGIVTKDGFLTLGEDTIINLIVNEYRGNLQWQKTHDDVTWINIEGETLDTLSVNSDTEAMYRAMIIEGDCLPVYSDSAIVLTNNPVASSYVEPAKLNLSLISDSASLSNGDYIYTGATQSNNLEVGQVIIEEQTGGTIRKITETTQNEDTVFVKTEQATMEDIFYDESFKLSTAMVVPTQNLKSASLAEIEKALTDDDGFIHPVEVIYLDKNGATLKSISIFSENVETQKGMVNFHQDWSGFSIFNYADNFSVQNKNGVFVSYNGSARSYIAEGFCSFDSDFIIECDYRPPGIEWNWGSTKIRKGELKSFNFYSDSAKVDFRHVLGFDLNIGFEVGKEWTLIPDIVNVKFKYLIGAVPFWVDVKVDLKGSLKASFAGGTNTLQGFHNTNYLTLGAKYENKDWSPIYNIEKNTESISTGEKDYGKLDFRLDLYPSVQIKMYNVIGPYLNFGPYLNYEVVSSGDANWNKSLDFGFDANLGVSAKVLGVEIASFNGGSYNFFNYNLWQSPLKLSIVSGDNQSADTSAFLPQPLIVEVRDNYDNPVENVKIYYEPSDNGMVEYLILRTDSTGQAKVNWKLSKEEGTNLLRAFIKDGKDLEIPQATVTFSALGKIEDKTDFIVYGGKTYKTVKIGDQWWMAENLAFNTSKSIAIPTFGCYYTWEEALSVCPSGWHLPSDSEWTQLATFINNEKGPYEIDGDGNFSGVGGHLKSLTGWLGDSNGSDSYGFNGKPTGFFGENSEPEDEELVPLGVGEYCAWWSATQKGVTDFSFKRYLTTYSIFSRGDSYIGEKFNVRCVKD